MLPRFLSDPNPDIYMSDNFVVVDFETTNKDKGWAINKDNRLVSVAWKIGHAGAIHNTECDEMSLGWLVELVHKTDFMVAANAKFDLQWLSRCGVDLTKVLVFDTQVAEFVLSESLARKLSLEACASRRGLGGKIKTVSTMIKQGICPSEIPARWLARYGKGDVDQTYKVFVLQLEELESTGRLPVVYSRCLMTVALADIEMNGMCLDKQAVVEELAVCKKALYDNKLVLNELVPGINWNSSKAKAGALYSVLGFAKLKNHKGEEVLTDSGKDSTSVPTILQLKAKTPEQKSFKKAFVDWNKAKSLKQKNLDFFHAICTTSAGPAVFHAKFIQTRVVTHRLSSTGAPIKFVDPDTGGKAVSRSVQFHNMPREYKKLFCARQEGYEISEYDGAALEFRVAAHLGNDEVAIQDIVNKEDIHQFTADTLTNAGEETNRQDAKKSTFSPLFGGRGTTDARKAYSKAFREKYKGIDAAQKSWTNIALKTQKLTTQTGYIFSFPGTKMTKSGYIENTTSIYNYPIQQLATGDIIPCAVVYQWHRMKAADMKSFLVNTIHDSTVGEVAIEEKEEYKRIAVQAFTSDVYFYLKKVYNIEMKCPLGIGHKSGINWGKGEEEKVDSSLPDYSVPLILDF